MSEQALLIPNALPPSPSQAALLPWEDADAFARLREEYFTAYAPGGPAERHILEQLVWCDWRRRRLLLGERALHMASLDRTTGHDRFDALSRRALAVTGGISPERSSAGVIKSDDAEDAESEAEWAELVTAAEHAETLLETSGQDAYAPALASLSEETADWFLETCEAEEHYEPNADGLQRFLGAEILPFFRKQLAGARGGPLVRLQAWGESLDPDRMDRLMQLDERLTRQYEKLMGMLERTRRISAPKPPR